MGNRGAASGKSGGGSRFQEVTNDSIFDPSVNEWKHNMTWDEKDTVIDYTGSLYYPLNNALRSDAGGYSREIKDLDSALGKFNLSENIVTYREFLVTLSVA